MSATKTLLELAAKAAGKNITWGKCASYIDDYQYLGVTGPWINNVSWNPLLESDKALELAATLCLTIQIGRLDGTIVVTSNNDDRIYAAERYDFDLASKMEAIRIAIVYAAAELGKVML